MSSQVTPVLLSFEADHVWVRENLAALLERYADQWVAVRDRRVIASDIDLARLRSRLSDPVNTCVEFITREPMEMVL